MHIHSFQHDHFEDLAFIGEWASTRGYQTSYTRFDLGQKPPDLSSINWLIIMGGKMGTYEETEFPWLTEEKEYIRKAIYAGKIVIGICLGSQLVAAALESKVFKNKYPETGFFPVRFNEDAFNDVVFRHFPKELTAFHVHNDTFEMPEGAVLMASSEATANQAFRFGKNVFAFQFHFEITAAGLPYFLSQTTMEPEKGKWKQDIESILKLASSCNQNNKIFAMVLDEIALLK